MSVTHSAEAKIEFLGELSISSAIEMHDRLSRALANSETLLVSVHPDADVDLTFVQLIESARRTARETGRQLALETPAAGQLRNILERGGFLEAPDRRAFWLAIKDA